MESIGAIEERRSILEFLSRYSITKANPFRRQDQLANIVQTVEWWGLVGCQLCFAATGQREPDHNMYLCRSRGAEGEMARFILQ